MRIKTLFGLLVIYIIESLLAENANYTQKYLPVFDVQSLPAQGYNLKPIKISTGYGDNPTADVLTEWNEAFFESSSYTYNHSLAQTAITFAAAAYVDQKPDSVIRGLKGFGFSDNNIISVYTDPKDDHDVVSYVIAAKALYNDTALVAVLIKGTSANEEWYSNFNIGSDTKTHKGFDAAKDKLFADLNDFLNARGMSPQSAKFFITGHSRGAAVANLVAAELITSKENGEPKYAFPENVYAYTFASPRVSELAVRSGYENIFNIVNAEDFITRIPPSSWGYGRYGTDLYIPSVSFSSNYYVLYDKMNSAFSSLIGKDYNGYDDGTESVDRLIARAYELAPSRNDYYYRDNLYDFSLRDSKITVFEYFNIIAKIKAEGIDPGNVASLLGGYLGDYRLISHFFITKLNKITAAHCPAAYYSWMTECTGEELFGTENSKSNIRYRRVLENN